MTVRVVRPGAGSSPSSARPPAWNEYIHCAYTGHQREAIFLTGIPDIRESLPHASAFGSPAAKPARAEHARHPGSFRFVGKARPTLPGIGKRGDRYLWTLLIHGARSSLRYVWRRTDGAAVGRWPLSTRLRAARPWRRRADAVGGHILQQVAGGAAQRHRLACRRPRPESGTASSWPRSGRSAATMSIKALGSAVRGPSCRMSSPSSPAWEAADVQGLVAKAVNAPCETPHLETARHDRNEPSTLVSRNPGS